jgi:hypothetical protein
MPRLPGAFRGFGRDYGGIEIIAAVETCVASLGFEASEAVLGHACRDQSMTRYRFIKREDLRATFSKRTRNSPFARCVTARLTIPFS